ncbi:MAG: hypothetical protein KDJ31_17610 [Candidatus Competibacteraceae bacterium]|nr:hypothetical protein [Candidatus Competibacteraceae bacterium]
MGCTLTLVPDIQDGTTTLQPSPLPGSIGIIPTTVLAQPRALLQELLDASNGPELQTVAVALFGQTCFSVGVIVGIGSDIITSVVDLLKLAKILVLADLYDLQAGQAWWQLANPMNWPRALIAELAGIVFEETLRQAAEERDALVLELKKAIEDPTRFFEDLAGKVWDGYKKDWQDFNAYMAAGTLEGRFRAGMIFGPLLFDIVSLIVGIVGAAKAVAKISARFPRLLKLAQGLKGKKLPTGVRRGVRAGRGGGGAPKAPSYDNWGGEFLDEGVHHHTPPPKAAPKPKPVPKEPKPAPAEKPVSKKARLSGKNPPISPRQKLHTNGTLGKSQFKPGIDAESVTRTAWEQGTPVFDKNGKFLGKRFTFKHPIGTSPSGHNQHSIFVHWSPTKGIHGVPTTVGQ